MEEKLRLKQEKAAERKLELKHVRKRDVHMRNKMRKKAKLVKSKKKITGMGHSSSIAPKQFNNNAYSSYTPEPAFILSQLNDLVRFCTTPGNFSVLTVDPTFYLEDFDVTSTAYHQLLLRTVWYDTSPVFIGPTMVHYRKTFGTYLFFASSLIGIRPELQALQAFGTDREKADAFGHEYR